MSTSAVAPIVALDDDAATRVSVLDVKTLVGEPGENTVLIVAYSTEGPWQDVLNVYATPAAARRLRDALTEALHALDANS